MSGTWVRRRRLVENSVGATASHPCTFTVWYRTTASVAVRCVQPLFLTRSTHSHCSSGSRPLGGFACSSRTLTNSFDAAAVNSLRVLLRPSRLT